MDVVVKRLEWRDVENADVVLEIAVVVLLIPCGRYVLFDQMIDAPEERRKSFS